MKEEKWQFPDFSDAMNQHLPTNYSLRYPKYHLIETINPVMEVHWGVMEHECEMEGCEVCNMGMSAFRMALRTATVG